MTGYSQMGLAYTKHNEGLTLIAVKDSVGYEIGYGHNDGSVKPGMTWTEAQADFQAIADYTLAWNVAEVFCGAAWGEMGEPRQCAIADMAYEMGPSRLGGFRMMSAAIRAGEYDTAAYELMRSDYATQVPDRAATNRDIMITGGMPRWLEWPAGA